MSSRPLVSIVMPFLNSEKFIEAAVQSVIAQSWSSWELLMVDGGSIDRSATFALQYAQQYPSRVRYLLQRKPGTSAARNLGIRNSNGRYIAFLDSDDVWLRNALEHRVAILESQPEAAMMVGSAEFWHSWNREDVRRDFEDVMYAEQYGVHPNTLVKPPRMLNLILREIVPCPSTYLVRREAIEHVGGFEEIFLSAYDDQALLAKIYLDAPVFVSSECTTRHREHPNSIDAVEIESGERPLNRLFFLKWLEAYLAGHRLKDEEVSCSLRAFRNFAIDQLTHAHGSAKTG